MMLVTIWTPKERKEQADYLRSLPKEIRWHAWSDKVPAYLIRRGVTSPKQGLLLALEKMGPNVPLDTWMRELLQDD